MVFFGILNECNEMKCIGFLIENVLLRFVSNFDEMLCNVNIYCYYKL